MVPLRAYWLFLQEIVALLDQPELRLEGVKDELDEITSAIVVHPKTSVEAAIAAASDRAKISLLAAASTGDFVEAFKARVEELSREEKDNFEMVLDYYKTTCLIFSFAVL